MYTVKEVDRESGIFRETDRDSAAWEQTENGFFSVLRLSPEPIFWSGWVSVTIAIVVDVASALQ